MTARSAPTMRRNPAYDHPYRAIVGTGKVGLTRCADCGALRPEPVHQARIPVAPPAEAGA